jgi:signal transduction histidine kinase
MAERRTKHHCELADLVADVATTFATRGHQDCADVIDEALARVGAFVGADRAYLMVFDDLRGTSSNTNEWCADGILPQIDELQDVPLAIVPWFVAQLSSGVVCTTIDELPPEAATERAMLEAQGIQSILILPILQGGRLTGFVGFDAVTTCRTWRDSDARTLRIVSNLIGASIERLAWTRSDQLQQQRIRALLQAVPDLILSVTRDGGITYQQDLSSMSADRRSWDGKGISEPLCERLIEELRKTLDSGEPSALRYQLDAPSGPKTFEARVAAQDKENGVVIIRDVTAETLAQRLVEDHRQRLMHLTEQMSRAEDTLRIRIAAEVHDGIAQEVALAKLLLAKAIAKGDPRSELMVQAMAVLEGIVGRISQINAELYPATLRGLGLPAALREIGCTLSSRHEIVFELKSDIQSRPPSELESLLYWSIRELIVNSVKHSEATKIEVRLCRERGAIVGVVEDDGCGIRQDPFPLRSGLFNIRERLRNAGGDLAFEPRNLGTAARVSLPSNDE